MSNELISPSFRKPHGPMTLGNLATAMEHAKVCQDFAMDAPIIYVGDEANANSFMLRLQSVQGPNASDSAASLARRVLTILTESGLKAVARMPRGEGFLKPIKN